MLNVFNKVYTIWAILLIFKTSFIEGAFTGVAAVISALAAVISVLTAIIFTLAAIVFTTAVIIQPAF